MIPSINPMMPLIPAQKKSNSPLEKRDPSTPPTPPSKGGEKTHAVTRITYAVFPFPPLTHRATSPQTKHQQSLVTRLPSPKVVPIPMHKGADVKHSRSVGRLSLASRLTPGPRRWTTTSYHCRAAPLTCIGIAYSPLLAVIKSVFISLPPKQTFAVQASGTAIVATFWPALLKTVTPRPVR